MTTFGKRGERVVEREIFLPDSECHVLIAADLSRSTLGLWRSTARTTLIWGCSTSIPKLASPGTSTPKWLWRSGVILSS